MEFWAAEVKSGEPVTVQPGHGYVVHLSQASLGELTKDKGSENVILSVGVDGKNLVLGTLNTQKLPQQQFDLVFDRGFELSHNMKDGTVFFIGYKASNVFEDEGDFEVDSDDYDSGSDEDVPATADLDEMSESSEEDSEEETPKKAETSKKRSADSAAKTAVSNKKAKLETPKKSEGKKGEVHVATPHPAKQAGKTPENKKQQTPKSVGAHHCKPCNRGFGSESALESHNKAKHSSGK